MTRPPSNLRTGPYPTRLPDRDDRWDEEITPGEVAGMVVAAIFVIVGLIVAGGFFIVTQTPVAK